MRAERSRKGVPPRRPPFFPPFLPALFSAAAAAGAVLCLVLLPFSCRGPGKGEAPPTAEASNRSSATPFAATLVFSEKEERNSFTIAFTGADAGVLEPCGCTEGMLGGIGRRAAFLEAVLPEGRPGVIVATGGICAGSDPLDVLRYETLLVAMNEMGYAAAGVGPAELALGPERLRKAASLADFPLILTNVHFDGEKDPPFERVRTLDLDLSKEKGGGTAAPGREKVRIRIFAVISPGEAERLPRGAVFEPPGPAVAKAAGSAAGADFDILLVYGGRGSACRLAPLLPAPRLLVYATSRGEPRLLDLGGGAKDSAIVTPGGRGRFVGIATIARRGKGAWRIRDSFLEGLGPSLPSSHSVDFALEIYRGRILLEGILQKMTARRFHPSGAFFIGSEACAECHPEAFAVLKRSAHARAFETLVRAGRDYDPGCLSCHTTGFGFKTGFTSAGDTPAFLAVGCEACHGPGSLHVEKGAPTPGRARCGACHDRDHSPGFDRGEAWPKIRCPKEDTR